MQARRIENSSDWDLELQNEFISVLSNLIDRHIHTTRFGETAAAQYPAWLPTSAKSQGPLALLVTWNRVEFACVMSVPNRCSAQNRLRLTCLGKIPTPIQLV